MKLKVQRLMDATLALTSIINAQRHMPQLGKYRIARLHAKLLPEFKVIDARRDEMIKAYGRPQMRVVPDAIHGADEPPPMEPVEGQWQVPPDKMPEFIEAWKVIGDEEIEVDVQPVPVSCLSMGDDIDGAIDAHELIALGDLVTE